MLKIINSTRFKSFRMPKLYNVLTSESFLHLSILKRTFHLFIYWNTSAHTRPVKGNHHSGMFYPQRPRLFMPFCMKYTCLLLLLQFYVIHAAHQTSCHQPTRTLNPLGSQSHWRFSHLPIMQASWRWNGSVKEGINKIWAPRLSTPCCLSISHPPPPPPLPPQPMKLTNLRGNHELRSSAATFFLIPSGLPHHTLLASKNLFSPVSQKSLRRVVVSDCKSSAWNGTPKRRPFFPPFEDRSLRGRQEE